MSKRTRKTYSGIQYVNETIRRLRNIVSEMKLTDYQLANRSGVNQSSISRWWSENVEIRLSNLYSVCSSIGISVKDLLEEEDVWNRDKRMRRAKQIVSLLDEERLDNLLKYGDYLVQDMLKSK